MASDSCNKNDLAQRKIALLLWGLPVVLLAVGVFWFEVRVWLWAVDPRTRSGGSGLPCKCFRLRALALLFHRTSLSPRGCC